jgi:hypothetical protein
VVEAGLLVGIALDQDELERGLGDGEVGVALAPLGARTDRQWGRGRRVGRWCQRWVVQARRMRLRTVMTASAKSKKALMTLVRRS